MNDVLITALSKSKNIHAYIALTTNTATTAQHNHNMNMISSAIYTRALTAGVLLGGNLKNNGDKLVLSWNCTGDAKKILIESNYAGEVRGFIENNALQLIPNSQNGADISSEPYIGFGEIMISRYSAHVAEPYHSVTVIETGEIAEDITAYLEQSLQVQSAMNIGLSIDKDNKINAAGGILLMAMPGATTDELTELFDKFSSIESFTSIISDDTTNFAEYLLNKFDLDKISEKPLCFKCHCDESSIKAMFESLDDNIANDYRNKDGNIEAVCQYCNKKYIL